MAAGHGHAGGGGHGHRPGGTAGHDHTAAASRTRLQIALALTAAVLVVEVIGAVVTRSLALFVDAAHMLTDVAGLATAVVASRLADLPTSDRRTWGWARAEVLGALAQAALLLGVGVFALVEGVRRLFSPPEVLAGPLVVFGAIGLVANIVALLVLAGGRRSNLNMRAAFLEVVNDALGSVGVIVAALCIALFGWQRADAIVGILIAGLIIPRTLVLLRAAGSVLMEQTPPGLDLAAVRSHILALPHVREVHDLHASRVASNLPVLSAHVVVDEECFTDGHTAALLNDLQECVAEHFVVSIEHSTFQFEPPSHRDEGSRHV